MRSIATALFVVTIASVPAAAEPLSYDYAYLSHQQAHVDGRSFGNDTLGAYYEIGARLHLVGSLGNAGSYGNPAWKDSRAVRLGMGGHFLIGEDTLFALEGAIVRAQFRNAANLAVRDTGSSAIFEVRHRFAPWVELIGSASHSDVLNRRTNELVVGPVFHLNRTFACGVFYQHTERSSGIELTVRTYY